MLLIDENGKREGFNPSTIHIAGIQSPRVMNVEIPEVEVISLRVTGRHSLMAGV